MKEHKDKCEHKKGEAICMNCPIEQFEISIQRIMARRMVGRSNPEENLAPQKIFNDHIININK